MTYVNKQQKALGVVKFHWRRDIAYVFREIWNKLNSSLSNWDVLDNLVDPWCGCHVETQSIIYVLCPSPKSPLISRFFWEYVTSDNLIWSFGILWLVLLEERVWWWQSHLCILSLLITSVVTSMCNSIMSHHTLEYSTIHVMSDTWCRHKPS